MTDLGSLFDFFIKTGLPSLFDPNPVTFTERHESGVAPLKRLLSKPTFQIQKLPRKLIRNAFLCGCLDYTEQQLVEHLIIGYGQKRLSTTDISHVQHFTGNENSVILPPMVFNSADIHCLRTKNSEVIVFHSHPRSWFNFVADNAPLPSTADRDTMLMAKLRPFQLIRSIFGTGGIRFFVGENGYVREIKMPNLITILNIFSNKQ
jgi:hypothetical protein